MHVGNPIQYVNPLQGTASDRDFSIGNTLPLVARPFGMHHWSLQTSPQPFFFHSAHRKLWGVRLTHQPSPWMGDYGSLLVSAFHGPVRERFEDQAAAYRILECLPHSLRLELPGAGIGLEMSCTGRGAIFVFTTRGEERLKIRFRFEAEHALNAAASPSFHGFSNDHSWGVSLDYPLSFFGDFDQNPAEFSPLPDGGYWTFPREIRRVEMRLAASFVDTETARLSHTRELSSQTLTTIRHESAEMWNSLLSRFELEPGDDRQNRTFYSCLYRCLLFPRIIEEFDAHGRAIHRSPYDGHIHSGAVCTDNGFWDTHRSVYPLLAFAYPEILPRILEGWLNACRQAGWAPKWASPGLRDCMIGTHFDAVVADAVARGVTAWNVEEAWSYLWKNATVPSEDGRFGRQGLEDYARLGYVPAEKFPYAVSSTLDYAYDDFCISQVAAHLGRKTEARELAQRSQNYRNVFDPAVGFMRPRLADGTWAGPFREFAWGGPYVEGGPWQHVFNVPHDPAGLAALLGGPEALCRKLDAMLAMPPYFEVGHYPGEIHEMTEMAQAPFGQYSHSNQPVHGFLFLYALNGQPEKTAHWVHRVATELYSPDALPGDEDNGEMCAWYIWAMLGRHPHCPGKRDLVHFGSQTRVQLSSKNL